MPTSAIRIEQRSRKHKDLGDITNRHIYAIAAKQQQTYVAVAAKPYEQSISTYKLATFHTVDKDNNFPYPFEDIPNLIITGRYSGATLPKNDIIFRHIFERGHAATREVLQACRTYAAYTIRKRLGIALQMDAHGDRVIVDSKKTSSRSELFRTRDI